jgi:hypothetical protein
MAEVALANMEQDYLREWELKCSTKTYGMSSTRTKERRSWIGGR